MNANESLMQQFYAALNAKDYAAMQACYSPQIIFLDPAFGLLQGDEAFAMWQMLCKGATDLKVEASAFDAPDEYGTCTWVATYTFSATKRPVVNRVKAHMRFRDGKIIEHTDQFDMYKWSRQAFGPLGWLIGWSPFFQRSVQRKARKRLTNFINKNFNPNNQA